MGQASQNKYLLGIDNGGTVTKAALFDSEGKEIAAAGCRTKMEIPQPGFIERDMKDLWNANVGVIREVLSKSGINPESIAGIAVTGHGNGLYLVDENGSPAYRAIYSADTRASMIVSNWYQSGLYDKLHPKLLQAIWAGQPVALLSWLKQNFPEILQNTRWVFLCKDYIRYCLTGEAYAELTDLSGSNLMNTRDGIYDNDLLKAFDLEDISMKLPPLKLSSEVCGFVTQEAARLTGLKEGTPVAGGLFDIDACAIATGIVDESKASITAGTWSINQFITRNPVNSRELFLNTLYCIPGYRLITEASPTSASNLEWFVEQFFQAETPAADEPGKSIYDRCNDMVEKIQPEECNILFLPFLFGTNVEPDARSAFIGLKGWHTRAHLLRSVYEGIVLGHRYHFEKLLSFRSRPEVVRISGGASRSRVWVQIFADVLQLPVEVVKGSELGAMGAALCAGVAVGMFDSFEAAAANMVETAYTCYPDPLKKEVYEKKYTAYKSILRQLAQTWKSFE